MSATSGAGSAPGGPAAAPPTLPPLPPPPPVRDIRSAELVSRLLAATPPYLYNMPVVPNSYFFSEMLRSFVHAKNNSDAAAAAARTQGQQQQQQPTPNAPTASAAASRRSRKRSWNQIVKASSEGTKHEWPQHALADPWHNNNKPLELTTTNRSKHVVAEERREPSSPEPEVKLRKSPAPAKEEKFAGLLPPPPPPATGGLTLPPPPPPALWYPPLYPPPYGLDPLNFFIDLRVSGHIYDRKQQQHKDGADDAIATARPALLFDGGQHRSSAFKDSRGRHASAFSVPKPRDAADKQHHRHFPMKYFDDVVIKGGGGRATASAHYVMQNLKRIYGDLARRTRNGDDDDDEEDDGVKSDPEAAPRRQEIGAADPPEDPDSDDSEGRRKRREDLRALIGLELVVDYVKGGRVHPARASADEEAPAEGDRQ